MTGFSRRRFLRVTASAVGLPFGSLAISRLGRDNAFADTEFPSRTIKFIVPTPPGTLIDLIPRLLAPKLSLQWGKSVVIENHPGAEQVLGAELVARAEPDGHTLLVTPPGPIVLDQWLDSKLAFDPAAFAPVTVLVRVPSVLVVNADVPAKTFDQWVAYARANPGKLNYGSPGGTAQLAQADLMHRLDLKLVHIPYQGMAPAINDLVAGQIQTMFAAAGTILPQIKAGKVRAIALTGGERIAELPGVPVLSELVPRYDHTEWFGMMAPPRTPLPVVTAIWQGIADAFGSDDIGSQMKASLLIPVHSDPSQAATFIAAERARWRAIVEAQR